MDLKDPNATSKPYGRFLPKVPETLGKSHMHSFHQLAAKLKADREKRTGQPIEDKSLGREYFMKKKFEVGELEGDLKSLY